MFLTETRIVADAGIQQEKCFGIPCPILFSSHVASPSPMWIPTLLGSGWVGIVLRSSDGTGLKVMNADF